MVNVCFIRHRGKLVERGYVADIPFNSDISYVKPFIIVQIDEKTIPPEIAHNKTVHLKLDELMERYPNKTETIELDGESVEVITYGYFHEKGISSKPYPIISMEEVDYE